MDPLRRLIDAVPRATLAEILHEMLAAEPAKRRPPGRPRKPSRPRGRPRKPPAGNGADHGEARPALSGRPRRSKAERRAAAEPAAKALWAKAEELSDAPWRLVADRFGINPHIAVDAYRDHRLPPGVSAEAAAAFA